jgi:hypothetical protein
MALQTVSTSSSRNQPSAGTSRAFPPHPRARDLPSSALLCPSSNYRVFALSRTMRAFSRPSQPPLIARQAVAVLLHPPLSTLSGAGSASGGLHGRPQPLFAPCPSPVPRAGFCPASPAAAPLRHRAANLLLYQVEQATTSAPARRADFSPPPHSAIGLSPHRHTPLRRGLCTFVPTIRVPQASPCARSGIAAAPARQCTYVYRTMAC